MSKHIIYITEAQLQELKQQVTFFCFKNKLIAFLKQLLEDPINATLDGFFPMNGISRSTLMKQLLKRGIIERDEKVKEEEGKSVYTVKYTVPRANFKTKLKRLYSYFFERSVDTSGLDNMKADDIIQETDCAGVGAVGDGSDSSGQFVQPLFTKINRREIYKPNTQDKEETD